jgi:hypothetical protein
MEQTAVEWLINQLEKHYVKVDLKNTTVFLQAKEMEKQRMIDLVQQLKDYTRESNNVLGFDEREANEFVEIFYQQNL